MFDQGAMTNSVAIANISIGDRMRQLNVGQVSLLQESIRDFSLLHPIVVVRESLDATEGARFHLVAGAHRLAACVNLGWAKIPATILVLSELERTIAECDENLCGTRLRPAERAMLMARRKAAYEALHPKTRQGAVGRGRGKSRQVGDSERFTADTAARTGASERAVQRDVQRGKLIAPDVLASISNTGLDKGSVLDELAATPVDAQVEKAEEIRQRARREMQLVMQSSAGRQASDGERLAGSRGSHVAKLIRKLIGPAEFATFANMLTEAEVPDFLAELQTIVTIDRDRVRAVDERQLLLFGLPGAAASPVVEEVVNGSIPSGE